MERERDLFLWRVFKCISSGWRENEVEIGSIMPFAAQKGGSVPVFVTGIESVSSAQSITDSGGNFKYFSLPTRFSVSFTEKRLTAGRRGPPWTSHLSRHCDRFFVLLQSYNNYTNHIESHADLAHLTLPKDGRGDVGGSRNAEWKSRVDTHAYEVFTRVLIL